MFKLLFALFLFSCSNRAEADLTSEIVNRLVGTFVAQEGAVNIAGYSCYISSNARFSSWKLKFDSKVQCPEISPEAFEARGYSSRTGAKEHAVRGFFERANNERRLTEQQWSDIANYLGISTQPPPTTIVTTTAPRASPEPAQLQFTPEQYQQLLQLLLILSNSNSTAALIPAPPLASTQIPSVP